MNKKLHDRLDDFRGVSNFFFEESDRIDSKDAFIDSFNDLAEMLVRLDAFRDEAERLRSELVAEMPKDPLYYPYQRAGCGRQVALRCGVPVVLHTGEPLMPSDGEPGTEEKRR